MATRRKRTKREAGRKQPARRAAPRPTGGRTRGRRAGARTAKAPEAARELRAPEQQPGAEPAADARPSPLRLAEPPGPDEAAEAPLAAARDDAGDREAAELARRIEAAVGAAGEGLRTGPASAADQLRLHREQTEEAARRQEDARRLPGAGAIALELAGGAWRLARTLATAPLRLGLAFLRRGDAPA